jgi:ribosomal protein S18 acetylase RimI-like enzyme
VPTPGSVQEDPVAHTEEPQLRLARPADAEAIAALHAASWRRHYRGAYSDAFLDGDVVADRLAVWADRLRAPAGRTHTILAEDGAGLVGFAHTIFDDDPTWGALLDNLHVAHRHQRRGVGSRLLGAAARAVSARGTGLYLWVQEQNVAAQAFYRARGGTCVGRAPISPPGGIASRLNGSPAKLRYAWAAPAALLRLAALE